MMIQAAVVGYGNIGKFAVQAVQAAPDMELTGVVRRKAGGEELPGIRVVEDFRELGKIDVAILCTPTRRVLETAKTYLAAGCHTVDSFDIHGEIPAIRRELGEAARQAGKVSILSCGWDPGSDSVVRALLLACAPKGITYTNFGPGMSMGHTVAVKGIKGVAGALSMTIPTGTGVHRRMVYVQLEPDASLEEVTALVKADPYFSSDETHVIPVEDIDEVIDRGHGVNIVRTGVSGTTDNQTFEFNMNINNPALTSQVMVSCARAAMRQQSGCYTMIELPPIDLLPGDREKWVGKIV